MHRIGRHWISKLGLRLAVSVGLVGLVLAGSGVSANAASPDAARARSVVATVSVVPQDIWEITGLEFDTEQMCIDVGWGYVNDPSLPYTGFRCVLRKNGKFALILRVPNSCRPSLAAKPVDTAGRC